MSATTPVAGGAPVSAPVPVAGTRVSPGAGPATSILALAVRNARKTVRVPLVATFSIAMPLMMLVFMSQVFRGIADNPAFPAGVAYIDYLTPAIVAVAVLFNGAASGVAMATDVSSGMLDRVRALPVRGWTVFGARSLSDLVVNTIQVGVVVAVAGVAIDFRFQGTVGEALGAVGVVVALGWSFSFLFQFLGIAIRNPEATQMAGLNLLFPLTFASSAFIPTEGMPGWIQGFTEVNPLSLAADAARALVLGTPSGDAVTRSLVASAVVAVVGLVLASRAYRRASV